MKISQEDFCSIAIACNLDPVATNNRLRELYPDMSEHKPNRVQSRIESLRRRGILPLDSGNSVSIGEVLKGTSTLYASDGSVKAQWVKTDVPKDTFLKAFEDALSDLAESFPPLPPVSIPSRVLDEDLATVYISNDVHFGALMDGEESGKDWNTSLAAQTLQEAHSYLFTNSPNSKVGIIVDLGDTLEVNDSRNMTPKSGHVLAVDSRFYKILRAAYESFIYAINEALKKHELVYFYNIGGNHDEIPAIAIREVIRVAFKENPRVIINEAPTNIKYHQHGQVLLQFAHGHAMKMHKAGETMAADMQHVFSETRFRFSHLGHTHKDAVYDSAICRAESHRNIAPLNHYAYEHGYRTNGNTMKAITYHSSKGEIGRQIFNIVPN